MPRTSPHVLNAEHLFRGMELVCPRPRTGTLRTAQRNGRPLDGKEPPSSLHAVALELLEDEFYEDRAADSLGGWGSWPARHVPLAAPGERAEEFVRAAASGSTRHLPRDSVAQCIAQRPETSVRKGLREWFRGKRHARGVAGVWGPDQELRHSSRPDPLDVDERLAPDWAAAIGST